MKLSLKDYRNKVEGCWLGKNIGGTLGAPLECKRGVFDLTFYSHELNGEPLPNDDLDLQLLWLNVAEKYGRETNASILGEYWQMFIPPNWAEYGSGKNNMRMGLVPPLSGHVNNSNRNSCGSFIRSEIWACLAPGHPEIAVLYAYEDAIVDHSEEGVYGEIFFAAIESAAFVESDKHKLIDIGLSYIPSECAIAKVVALVRASYSTGVEWKELRKKILQQFPTTFGMLTGYEDREVEEDVPFGNMGYDAPANIGITILGWLYGEDDFEQSLLYAANCGEDADCTAATLGSIFGIIYGVDKMPKKWSDPIGNSIKTISLNTGDFGIKVPRTIDELTDRVVRLAPFFLGPDYCDVTEDEPLMICTNELDQMKHNITPINCYLNNNFVQYAMSQPYCLHYKTAIFNAVLDYVEDPLIQEGVEKSFKLKLVNNMMMPQWMTIKWHLPEGWLITPSKKSAVLLEHNHGAIGETEMTFTVTPSNLEEIRYDLIIEISSNSKHTKLLIPVVLLVSEPRG